MYTLSDIAEKHTDKDSPDTYTWLCDMIPENYVRAHLNLDNPKKKSVLGLEATYTEDFGNGKKAVLEVEIGGKMSFEYHESEETYVEIDWSFVKEGCFVKPEIVLKVDYDIFKEYTRKQIEAVRDEWISAYREIAESNSSKKELCDSLTERIGRAADLFIRRHIEPVVSDAISHDDSYYEWLDEVKKEENNALDGDFPLGNEEDMAFASPYFTVKELAQIQMGCADDIFAGHYVEYADRVLIRKGVLAEVKGEWKEAAGAYSGVSTSKMIQDREYACRRKMREIMLEHNEHLNKAYKELLEIWAKQDEQPQSIFSMQYKFYAAISDLR